MGIIDKDHKVTENYYISEEQIIELIAKDLGVPKEEISIRTREEDISTIQDRYPNMKFVGIEITRKYESS